MKADAFKPVVSEFDANDWSSSDPGRLLQALGRPLDQASRGMMAPYRYAAALSPPMAARQEGQTLRISPLLKATRRKLAGDSGQLMLVEGAGGAMSPIAEDGTCLDLIQALRLPVILVGGSYLGAISHTLTAVEVVRSRGLEIGAFVVSESNDHDRPDLQQTAKAVAVFTGLTITVAPRNDPVTWPAALLRRLAL